MGIRTPFLRPEEAEILDAAINWRDEDRAMRQRGKQGAPAVALNRLRIAVNVYAPVGQPVPQVPEYKPINWKKEMTDALQLALPSILDRLGAEELMQAIVDRAEAVGVYFVSQRFVREMEEHYGQ